MKLTVTITGNFADDLHEDDLKAFEEDLEDEARYYTGKAVTVEIVRQ